MIRPIQLLLLKNFGKFEKNFKNAKNVLEEFKDTSEK